MQEAPTNETDNYGLRYAEFVVPLVKAVQELNLKISQLENLKMENEDLKAQNARLEERLMAVESKLSGK